MKATLVIELDGDMHEGREAYDQERQRWIEAQGYRVLRYWNHEVLTNLDGIVETIRRNICERTGRVDSP